MSTVKTNNVQVGQSGTATNNFTLYQPAVPDGTVRLGVGNAGATTADAITVTSAGNMTVLGTVQSSGITTNIYPLVSGTAVASTSGTSIDFTGIPSYAKKVTVMFNGVSTTGTSQPYLQLGTSSGFEVTGYESGVGSISIAANTTSASISVTAAFPLYTGAIVAAAVISGNLTIANLSGNIWTVSGTVLSGQRVVTLGGVKTLASALTQIRLTTAGGVDTFDTGSMNILYE